MFQATEAPTRLPDGLYRTDRQLLLSVVRATGAELGTVLETFVVPRGRFLVRPPKRGRPGWDRPVYHEVSVYPGAESAGVTREDGDEWRSTAPKRKPRGPRMYGPGGSYTA